MMEMITRWVFLIQWALRESLEWVSNKIRIYSKMAWEETKSQTVEKSKSLWLKTKKTLRIVRTILQATLIITFLGSLLYGANLWWPELFIVAMPSKLLIRIIGLIVVGVLVLIYLFTRYLTKSDPQKSDQKDTGNGEKGQQKPDPKKDEDKKTSDGWWKKNSTVVLTGVGLVILVNSLLLAIMNDGLWDWYIGKPAFVFNGVIGGLVLTALLPGKSWKYVATVGLGLVLIFGLYALGDESTEAVAKKASVIYENVAPGGKGKAEKEEEEILLTTSIPAKGKSEKVSLPYVSYIVDSTAPSIVADIFNHRDQVIRRVDTTGKTNFGDRNNFDFLPDGCKAVFSNAEGMEASVKLIRVK